MLVPIVMKKGRPAHTPVCAHPRPRTGRAARRSFALTSTLGVREVPVSRVALNRDQRAVAVRGGNVRIKMALRAGRIVHATPEFDDAAILAQAREEPVRQVLREAVAAAAVAMLIPGARWPGEPIE